MGDHPHDLGDLGKVALAQLGTLGSGNHFVEVCLDERDVVWVLLHSGSRGVGNQLAGRHIKIAKAQEQGLEDKDLSYFLDTQPEFHTYISDMLWAQEYALENRELMITAALWDLFAIVGHGRERRRINCHHNYAIKERHDGRMVWITRKGAIRARKGDKGLIPGSMATGSFVVEGLGNPASYNSASHGAGRQMSRGQAKRTLTPESLDAAMGERAWNQNAKGLLDEHPAAYKDIGQVMSDQADLVRIVHSLHQILNYKGL
jgi:tRNA-splicing ligase RtcB